MQNDALRLQNDFPCRYLITIERVAAGYVTVELCVGGSLDCAASRQALRFDILCSWVQQITFGLLHLHNKWRRVHCDLQPANIFAKNLTLDQIVIGISLLFFI